MRVDLVAPYYAPVVGGIEDHVAALAFHAQAQGHDVKVHTLDQDQSGRRLPAREKLNGVRVRRWPAAAQRGYYRTRFEPRLDGDLIHLHGFGLWTHDWVARNYAEAPKLMTLHHGLEIPAPNLVHRAYHAWHWRRAARRTVESMDVVVAVNRLDARRLSERGIQDVDVRVIPNGVPDAAFEAAVPAQPPGSADQYFLCLGRLHEEKDVDHALRALAQLPAGVGLRVAGPDHGARQALVDLARRLGLEGRVGFEGRVSEDRKRALLAGARALVLPSRYEAQGRVILESWAQRRPVVASAVGGVPEMVDDTRDGFTYAFGDLEALVATMGRLAESPGLADRAGGLGWEKAQADYREPVLMDKVLKLYQELV